MNTAMLIRQKISDTKSSEIRSIQSNQFLMEFISRSSPSSLCLTVCFSPIGFRKLKQEIDAMNSIYALQIDIKPRTFDGVPIYIVNRQQEDFRVVVR